MSDNENTAVPGEDARQGMGHEGFCPVCLTHRPSLPEPAHGTCAYCYNHLMVPCQNCKHFYGGSIGGMHVGMPACNGSPNGRKYDFHWARRNDNLCGPEGKWAEFDSHA